MAAGVYTTPVLFQSPTNALGPTGAVLPTYSDTLSTGAQVMSLTGREINEIGLDYGEEAIEVTVRYSPTANLLVNTDVVVIYGTTYVISSVRKSFDRSTIVINARIER